MYTYLLRHVPITRVDHVWSTDITYIPLQDGHVYLCAVIDWHSRYVINWSVMLNGRTLVSQRLAGSLDARPP